MILEFIVLFQASAAHLLYSGGHRQWHADSCVPDRLVLVLLCSVGRAVLLALAGHAHVALRELGQALASKLSLEDRELESALLPIGAI